MSELSDKLWAVLSENGTEATGLTYGQALELMRSLQLEKVSGLSIITAEAARRATHKIQPRTRQSNSNGAGSKIKVKG